MPSPHVIEMHWPLKQTLSVPQLVPFCVASAANAQVWSPLHDAT